MPGSKQSNIDNENLHLLYGLAGDYYYKPASYTWIQEFTDSFPKSEILEFTATPNLPVPTWQPEAPYARIYTKSYKKTILTS